MAAPKAGQLKAGTADAGNDSPAAQATPQPGRYEIDTSCSAVTFRTRHLFGLAPVRGTFAIRAVTVNIAEPVTDSVIRAEIEAATFRTGSPQRDDTVRSARLLDTDQYPVMTFVSERIDGQAVTGTLTVRGLTRPVTLAVEQAAVTPRSFSARATTRIDRTRFGVTAYRGLAGRYLEMTVEVRCVRK
jgi:polyisoprenoid-binding protein YceI